MTISKALEMFVNEKRSEGVSEKTVLHYYQDIGYFIKFVNDKELDQIDNADVIAYRLYLLNKKKNDDHPYKPTGGTLSKVTINTYLRTLRTFTSFLAEYELIKPLKIKLLKEPKVNIEILEDEEIAEIMALPENGWVQQRNKLMIYMMLDSGLRRQELVDLRIHHVDLVNDLIKIKKSKGEKDRNVPLGRITKRLYIKYLNSRPQPSETTDHIFLSITLEPISFNALKMVLKRMNQKFHFKRFNPHYFRHTFATKFLINQYLRTGVSDIEQLREILGHDSTRVTRTYLHLANQYLIKTHQYGVLTNVQKNLKLK